jgi:hypothetical protein
MLRRSQLTRQETMGLDIGLNTEIRSEPGARVSMRVEAFSGEQDALELVLETAQHISWWKSLSYFIAVQGGRGFGPEIRVETKDRVHRASQLLYLPDLTRYGVMELWKGGFLGFVAFIGSCRSAPSRTGSEASYSAGRKTERQLGGIELSQMLSAVTRHPPCAPT